MRLAVLNCMDAHLIQQDVLLLKHVRIIRMNKHVCMLKVVMANVFIRQNNAKLFPVVTYLMVTLMRLV